MVLKGDIQLLDVSTGEKAANMLTKLPSQAWCSLKRLLSQGGIVIFI